MFVFRVIGWFLYKPQPPTAQDKFKTQDVTLVIPTIDTDDEALHEAMRSWMLNEPREILIVTVGEETQRELERIASCSSAVDITRVLRVEGKANKRIQLVHGARSCGCLYTCHAHYSVRRLTWRPWPWVECCCMCCACMCA